MQVIPAGRSGTAAPPRRAVDAATFEFLTHLSNATTAIAAVTTPSDVQQTLRERIDADEAHDRRVAEQARPTTSKDVVNAAERSGDVGSRAWRRQEARTQGAEQFHEARQARRDALNNAAPAQRSAAPAGTSDEPTSPDASGRQPAPSTRRDAGKPAFDSNSSPPAASAARSARGTPPAPSTPSPALHSTRATQPGGMQQIQVAVSAPTTIPATDVRAAGRTATPVSGAGASVSAAATRAAATAGRSSPAPLQTATESRSPVRLASASRAARGAQSARAESASRARPAEQVVRVLSQQLREGSARFVMRLKPAELGEIRVEMHLRGDRVALNIDTRNELAHRLLRQDEHTLRHGLEAAGVHVEHLEVRPPAAASENAQAGMQQQPDPHDAEQDGSARRDAERPAPSGTESPTNVEAPERVDDMVSEVAAESRVDVLA